MKDTAVVVVTNQGDDVFSPNEIRQQITSQIVEALSNGNLPPGVDRGQ
jgi:hypothetical protein